MLVLDRYENERRTQGNLERLWDSEATTRLGLVKIGY